jgi:surface polysaccharide O-acyltransferase-like enzyme
MIERRSLRRVSRSIGAVVAGFFATFVLSVGTDAVLHATGVFPALGQPMSDLLFVLATVYRTIYTIAGGYITARLAPDRPMRHAMVLGVIGMAAATAGTVATWGRGPEFGPTWYPISLVVLALPSIWVGARFRAGNVRS